MRKIIKVYCKRDYLTYPPYAYMEGHMYEAYQEDNTYIWVMTGYVGYLGGREGCRFYNSSVAYKINNNILDFNEYFCTLKEVRKEKIKKLSNEKNISSSL
jgi:hypothetical protein